jgi:hypothetical protein
MVWQRVMTIATRGYQARAAGTDDPGVWSAEQVLGPDHPCTQQSRKNLANAVGADFSSVLVRAVDEILGNAQFSSR